MNELEEMFPDPRRPFGSWRSPISAEMAAGESLRLGLIKTDGESVYWLEGRPVEEGRGVIVCWSPGERKKEVTPPSVSVRSRAHEYGGGDFCVVDGIVVYVDAADQRLYRLEEGATPQPISPVGNWRYADMIIDRSRDLVICLVEEYGKGGKHPQNFLGVLPLRGQQQAPSPLVEGSDFYACPVLSPDGTMLAWQAWEHPEMPWDSNRLWVAEFTPDARLQCPRTIAGGEDKSVFQPGWSLDGSLYFVSDSSGWWNLYRWREEAIEPVYTGSFEMGLPQWVFGMSTYAFTGEGTLVAAVNEKGVWHLVAIDPDTGRNRRLSLPSASYSGLQGLPDGVVCLAGSPREPATISIIRLDGSRPTVLQRAFALNLDADRISHPQGIQFPVEDGYTVHAFYYPPTHPEWVGNEEEKPPCIVMGHGGPTGAADPSLDLRTQFWTSRGFSVLDVNYRGSTGFGRAYRQLLDGAWGVSDVQDCIAAAQYLADQGKVDEQRLIITGGSAGGYTALAALAFHDVFRAASISYGISDLEKLVLDTHKFEARYLDRLVAPYPEGLDVFRERSPIYALDKISCPMIFFQGEDDKVVPPNQAEAMVEALRAKGVPVSYFLFPGEGHGFRRADTIRHVLEAQLSFFASVFNFEPADEVEPVEI